MATKSKANAAIRQSLERGFNAAVNPATKTAVVEKCETFALADFPQTASHEVVGGVFAQALEQRVNEVRRQYFAGSTLSRIRKDIVAFVRSVQEEEFSGEDLWEYGTLEKKQRQGIREIMAKHGHKLVQFPSPSGDEMYVKRLENIRVSRDQETEWDRAISLRAVNIDQDQQAMRAMQAFGKIAIELVNGAPTEFSQI